MAEFKHKRRWCLVGVGMLLILAMLVTSGVYLLGTFYPNPEAAQSVRKGMTDAEVVHLLGVMYDRYHLGQYKSADRIMAEMEDSASIKYVCCWRIGVYGDRFYVEFDKNAIARSVSRQRR